MNWRPGVRESKDGMSQNVEVTGGLDAIEEVVRGPRVYLSPDRSPTARWEMVRAVKRDGATKQAVDGNCTNNLRPERFGRDALVSVETRNLGHSANDLIDGTCRRVRGAAYVGPVTRRAGGGGCKASD
jgi:hypothetical protein